MKKRIYDKYKKHNFWKIIESAVDSLCINDDLEEKTARYYIVGYLTKCLCEQEKKLKITKNVDDGKSAGKISGKIRSGKNKRG